MKSRRMRPAVVMGSCGALVFALGTAGLLLGACTDDSDRVEGGSGGSGGGQPSSGGTPTAGGNPSTGGGGGGGGGGGATGGKGSGGDDGGTDDDGGVCKAPSFLAYDKPGCGGTVAPFCWNGVGDACAMTACACDGTDLSGCGVYNKPWRHAGSCADGGDSGPD